MRWLCAWCVLAAVYGGGVTQTPDPQLWADYKIFDHVYGKLFDKDLYGDTLPPTIRFGDTQTKATEKKEIYTTNSQEYDPYVIENTNLNYVKEKPTFNFLSYNGFKPISEANDPETYNYLKRLENADRERTELSYKEVNDVKRPEETYAYKVIQKILDAHEANKGIKDDVKYVNREKNNKKNRKPPRVNEGPKRCYQGRCRKRSSVSRNRSYPYYRKIKLRTISD